MATLVNGQNGPVVVVDADALTFLGTGDAADIPFSPTGTIASTNVQDAIAEVASEAGGSGLTQAQVLARGLGA